MDYQHERTPLLAPETPQMGPAGPSPKVLSETKVYPLIHLIRLDILTHIDTPLSHDQLIAPDSTYTIVRPLTEKYLALQNQSIIFCLLLNKVQFVRDSAQLSISTLSMSRATLCEMLAIRVLRGWSERSLPLATVLLTPWALFQGAPEEIMEKAKEEEDEDVLTEGGNALEMAIVSSSKRFIRSPSCQKVIEGIWNGRIIYSAINAHALIADNYKKKPIQMYNPHNAPLLDHYRLKVPKTRSFIEYTNFLVLFILYVVAIEGLNPDYMNKRELVFVIYALSYSLDKLATIREHGLKVFSSSLVNGFDFVFMLIYFVYLGCRVYGFHYHNAGSLALGQDVLAIGAVLIFPRLAFVTLADNLLVLSLRSMMTEFFFLMGIGIFCFLGFLYALYTLGQGRYDLATIGWWLLEVYFGLDASGFENANNLHRWLGPVLMITYALLSNTLLLTVLVAILGNTFAIINADAAAESMFRKAVSTIEGVKSDSVFSYQLPFNIVALVVMFPLSHVVNPRWFHKINVFLIRALNFPVLLGVALYERQQFSDESLWEKFADFTEKYVGNLPRRLTAAAGFENFGSSHNFATVFEVEREHGTFYRDYEENALAEDHDLLPPPALALDTEDSSSESDAERPHVHFSSDVEPRDDRRQRDHSESPSRSRHNSLPAHAQPLSHPNPLRPRRNSSIHEPSPLARLFVRAPGDHKDVIEKLRERRQSLAGLVMPDSPVKSPTKTSSEHRPSPIKAVEVDSPVRNAASPRLAPRVPSCAQSSTPSPGLTPMSSRPQSPAAGMRSRRLLTPRGEPSERSSSVIGKASQVAERESGGAGDDDPELFDRLGTMEERQKRIEEMLQQLLERGH